MHYIRVAPRIQDALQAVSLAPNAFSNSRQAKNSCSDRAHIQKLLTERTMFRAKCFTLTMAVLFCTASHVASQSNSTEMGFVRLLIDPWVNRR